MCRSQHPLEQGHFRLEGSRPEEGGLSPLTHSSPPPSVLREPGGRGALCPLTTSNPCYLTPVLNLPKQTRLIQMGFLCLIKVLYFFQPTFLRIHQCQRIGLLRGRWPQQSRLGCHLGFWDSRTTLRLFLRLTASFQSAPLK